MEIMPDEVVEINKKHLFEDFTTRKHYAGIHELKIIIYGKNFAKKSLS